jgi:hypothetical protein
LKGIGLSLSTKSVPKELKIKYIHILFSVPLSLRVDRQAGPVFLPVYFFKEIKKNI